MEEIEKIRTHPLYMECYRKLEKAEADRTFCRHQMPHLLDVARIAYIRNLEEKLGFQKEVIYAAALLHDIGKIRQYEDGIPHEAAGAEIAGTILADTGLFPDEVNYMIIRSIEEHRRPCADMTSLGRLLCESDKRSRACYACPAESQCNWSESEKNLQIKG